MILKASLLFLSLILTSALAEAKIFSFGSESFAAYLKGNISPAPMENTLNSKSHGATTTMDSELPYNFAGEFGFIYAQPRFQIRFGLELIHPSDKKDQAGTNAAGTAVSSMTSELSVVVPKVGLDLTLKSWNQARAYLGGTAGWATLVSRNSYTFTPTGTTEYGIADFYEDLRGSAPQFEGLLGYERVMSDATTVAVEGGYRSLVFGDINHNRDVTTFQGSVGKGDTAKNDDGSARTLDLTQYFVGLTLRFWIH